MAVSSSSLEPMTPASNCGAVTPTTSTSAKPKKALQWMEQSVPQERWGMSQLSNQISFCAIIAKLSAGRK